MLCVKSFLLCSCALLLLMQSWVSVLAPQPRWFQQNLRCTKESTSPSDFQAIPVNTCALNSGIMNRPEA